MEGCAKNLFYLPKDKMRPPKKLSRYKRISEYGIIGDMHSAALVGIDGSIDWCCFPRFDSPSVFAAILDADKGGRFQVAPIDDYGSEQAYEEDTNILATIFKTSSGIVKVTDFMPCFMRRGEMMAFHEIHRRIESLEGSVGLRLVFQPRMKYATGKTSVEIFSTGCVANNEDEYLSLASRIKLASTTLDSTISGFEVSESEDAWIVIKYGEQAVRDLDEYQSDYKLSKTRYYWRNWAKNIKYRGRWRDQVARSALTLKLLQYTSTGALVAAATTSLPEQKGGSRNWDYRYSWVRDAAFSLWALSLIGASREALDYMKWFMTICQKPGAELQMMLKVGGERYLAERELSHFEGYEGSRPVRVGNEACKQLQLDVYGALVDAIYFLYRVLGWTTKEVYENIVRGYADFVAKAWRLPDSGAWEMRTEPRYYVESRVWCHVALDRSVKLARYLGYDEDAERWKPIMQEIKKEILSKGWSERKGAFTMYYGNDSLDAANLLMPLVQFLPATHPKVASTIERIRQELSHNGLVYRYRSEDGLPGGEGAFTVCSFWMVECLVHLGKLEEAERLFNELLKYSNHLGLYSEEVDPETGEALGNFPQAYTHMGLISTAVHLDEALSKTKTTG